MRHEFSRKIKRQIIDRANGKCELCGVVLKTSEGEVDHILPDALGGKPELANGRLLCRACHKEKTAKDVRQIRKSDRQRDKASGAIKPKKSIKSPHKEKKEHKILPMRQGGIFAQYQFTDTSENADKKRMS